MSRSTLRQIEYPESDGQPMGETDVHRLWMIRIYDLLKQRYRHDRVYVGSDLLLYYTEGVPEEFVVPDDFVVLDSDSGMRRTFKIWEEGRVPNVVFEVTSRKTKKKDQVHKPALYARIGVKELFLYDPTGDYLRPRLQGLRLVRGEYRPIVPRASQDLECRELGLTMRLDGNRLAIFDAASGTELLTEAETERAGREQAEEEIHRLREQLRRRRRGDS
jgi:Uma2 family endonuclease